MTNKDLQAFLEPTTTIISLFNAAAKRYQLVGRAKADHICYKCGSSEEFEALRKLFDVASRFIYQSIISDRRIAIIKFLSPLNTVLGEIDVLELSDQKPDNSQTSGFDHIEIYPEQGSMASLAEQLRHYGVAIEDQPRSHHHTMQFLMDNGFKIRIEPEPVIETIKTRELF